MKSESKTEAIKKHLLSRKSITGHQALLNFGVYRLSSVINRLRKKDLNIQKIMIEDENKKDVYAKYFIPELKTNS